MHINRSTSKKTTSQYTVHRFLLYFHLTNLICENSVSNRNLCKNEGRCMSVGGKKQIGTWSKSRTHVAGADPIKRAHISWRMPSCPPDRQAWRDARTLARTLEKPACVPASERPLTNTTSVHRQSHRTLLRLKSSENFDQMPNAKFFCTQRILAKSCFEMLSLSVTLMQSTFSVTLWLCSK